MCCTWTALFNWLYSWSILQATWLRTSLSNWTHDFHLGQKWKWKWSVKGCNRPSRGLGIVLKHSHISVHSQDLFLYQGLLQKYIVWNVFNDFCQVLCLDKLIFNYTEKYQFTTRLLLKGEHLEVIDSTKLLGTIITNDLKWRIQLLLYKKRMQGGNYWGE